MDRRQRRFDHGDRKPDLRGHGDDRRDLVKRKDIQTNTKLVDQLGDRGDSPDNSPKAERPKRREDSKPHTKREDRFKNRLSAQSTLSEKAVQKIIDKMRMEVKPLDISKRRQLAQLYTFRRVNDSNTGISAKKEDPIPAFPQLETIVRVERLHKKQTADESKKEKTKIVSTSGAVEQPSKDTDRQSRKPVEPNADRQGNLRKQIAKALSSKIEASTPAGDTTKETDRPGTIRRPIIKTLTSKTDTIKVYKAVTFVEQSRKMTPLKINIPKPLTPPRSPPLQPSVTIVKEKEKAPKPKARRRPRVISPVLPTQEPVVTEVAKWAPSSVDTHTQRYYEAWVDTTLTAVSRRTRNDMSEDFYKKVMSQKLEPSPEPTYEDFTNERFTGLIRVKQRTK